MNSKITVLVVKPRRKPYIGEIEGSLENLQSIVGGNIQALFPYEDPVALICHEDGKLIGLPWNRPLRDDGGMIYDVIAGTFLVTGITKDNFGSLLPELVEKYTKIFREGF